tara:strand:+ start:113 stop:262 length:150 start_codon:yes stop_codon:yes gene_type:complete
MFEDIARMIESAGGSGPRVELIDEDLTWFGSRTKDALVRLGNLRRNLQQ